MAAVDVVLLKDHLGMAVELRGTYLSLWNVFYTVSSAVILIMLSGRVVGKFKIIAQVVLAAGFLLFSVGNYYALDDVRRQREALCLYSKDRLSGDQAAVNVIDAEKVPSLWRFAVYHCGLQLVVLGLIWVIPLCQTPARGKPEGQAGGPIV